MPWFKVDDQLAFHHKAVAAGNAAMGLWVRAGSFCSSQLTDGFVPDHMLAALGTIGQAKALVNARLWERVDGGYQFHEWNAPGRQPTREQVENERAEARQRMANRRKRSANVQANNDRSSPSGSDTPTRPDPTVVPNGTTEPAPAEPDAPAKPASIEHQVTDSAYAKLGKAFNFIAARSIVKWAIHERGSTPDAVEEALIGVHQAGKPITKQTVDQWLNRPKPDRRDMPEGWR